MGSPTETAFEVIKPLASAGNAEVLHARLAGGQEGVVRRFESGTPRAEFSLLAELDHPGIPRVLTCGVDSGRFWYAVEPFRGGVLEHGWPGGLDERPFVAAALHALFYLDACGARHGDVHPGNLVACKSGYPCGLIDFGFSIGGDDAPCGRPGFVAPEVLRGAPRGLASDLFGLGMSLRRRYAEATPEVHALVDGLLSVSPATRVAAAEVWAANYPRPDCRPRLEGRGAVCEGLLQLLSGPMEAPRALVVHGPPGSGKASALRWAELQARALGWRVQAWVPDDGSQAAWSWRRSARPLLVLADLRREAEYAPRLAEAVSAAIRAGDAGIRILGIAGSAVPGPWNLTDLPPLAPAELARLYRQSHAVRDIAGLDAADLSARTGGLPGALAHIASADRAAGLLRFAAGTWQLLPRSAPAGAADLSAASERIARLTGSDRRLLAATAVAREAFTEPTIIALAGVGPESLLRLLGAGLLRRSRATLAVPEPALAGAALGGLPHVEAARLHDAFAAEAEAKGLPAELVAELRIHGSDVDAAVQASVRALSALRESGRMARRRALLEQVYRICPAGHPSRARIDFWRLQDDFHQRCVPEMAEAAFAQARGDGGEDVRQAAFVLGLEVLIRAKNWDRVEDLRRQSWGFETGWVDVRLAYALATKGLTPEATAHLRAMDAACAGRFATSFEARLSGWLAAVEGRSRASARSELAAARLARREGNWSTWAQAVSAAMTQLTDLGLRSRALLLAKCARRRLNSGLRPTDLAATILAEADLDAACGEMLKSLARSEDWMSLMRSMGAAESAILRCQPVRLRMRRELESPEAVLADLEELLPRMDSISQRWTASIHILLLSETGRVAEAITVADRVAVEHRASGSGAGECWMHVLAAQACLSIGDMERAKTRLAIADSIVAHDHVLEGTRLAIRGRVEIRLGQTDRGMTTLRRALGLLQARIVTAREAAVLGALDLAQAGRAGEALQLIALTVPCVDSRRLAVLESIVAARAELSGVGALRILRTTESLLPFVAQGIAESWTAAAAEAAGRCGARPPYPVPRTTAPARAAVSPSIVTRSGGDPVETRNLAAEARRIQDIVAAINAELNLPRLLDRILETALSVSGAERGFIVFGEPRESKVRAARNLAGQVSPQEETFSRSVAEQVFRTGTPFLSRDATLDDRLEGAASVERLQVRSALCMPFRLHGELLGVFYLDHLSRADAFDPAVTDLLQTLADLAAVAIENARLFEENQQARRRLEGEAQTLREELQAVARAQEQGCASELRHPYATIAGRGAATCRMLRQVDRACDLALPVLISGETGTGKELVARALHLYGPSARGPFEAENCAAISPDLMESELFGHVKGAFSGAIADHEGLFRRANGGTVFLDEIGELSLPLQAKLLRVLEDGLVRPVGSDRAQKVKVRVLAATNRDLESLVQSGEFRQDLYFRLASVTIRVPALSERVEDIPALAKRFLARHGELGIEPGALKLLMKAPWPGNIRQLQNFVDVVAAISAGKVTESDVQEMLSQKSAPRGVRGVAGSLPESIDRYRREQALGALTDCDGDVTRAARQLGISYQAMRKLILKYELRTIGDSDSTGRGGLNGRGPRRPRR